MKKNYQIKRNLIIYQNFVISICLNYVDKTDFLILLEINSRAKIKLH